MAYRLIFREEAENDIAQAYLWYEIERRGLGEEFLLCLEAALDSLSASPHQYPIVERVIRRARLRRFPYAVFYILREQEAHVIAVMHSSRNPARWRERL